MNQIVSTSSFWVRLWHYYAIKSSIKHAKRLHEETHKQYYVIKVFNKIRVYDRNRINLLIRSGILSKQLKTAIELRKFCIYYTK